MIDINLISNKPKPIPGRPTRPAMKENPIRSLPGIPFLLGVLAISAVAAWLFISGVAAAKQGAASPGMIIGGLLLGLVAFLSLIGLYTVQPNQAAVISLFGKY